MHKEIIGRTGVGTAKGVPVGLTDNGVTGGSQTQHTMSSSAVNDESHVGQHDFLLLLVLCRAVCQCVGKRGSWHCGGGVCGNMDSNNQAK